jgi:hypothetical protein
MYAVRSKFERGFRVREVKYIYQGWRLEQEITPEHEFAAKYGQLVILEDVAGTADSRLQPFYVVIDGLDVATVPDLKELQAKLAALQVAYDALSSKVEEVRTEVATFPEQPAVPAADAPVPAAAEAVDTSSPI